MQSRPLVNQHNKSDVLHTAELNEFMNKFMQNDAIGDTNIIIRPPLP